MEMPTGFWRPTRDDLRQAENTTLDDLIKPNLRVLFVGINPGLYTAAIGHHFGRPGNRFWKVLHLAGFTARELSPFEEQELLSCGYGITNVVARATARADELVAEELRRGAEKLIRKIKRYSPRTVAFAGMQAYRRAFHQPHAEVGAQTHRIGDSSVWLLPNPSGLQAHYDLDAMVELYTQLRHATDHAEQPE